MSWPIPSDLVVSGARYAGPVVKTLPAWYYGYSNPDYTRSLASYAVGDMPSPYWILTTNYGDLFYTPSEYITGALVTTGGGGVTWMDGRALTAQLNLVMPGTDQSRRLIESFVKNDVLNGSNKAFVTLPPSIKINTDDNPYWKSWGAFFQSPNSGIIFSPAVTANKNLLYRYAYRLNTQQNMQVSGSGFGDIVSKVVPIALAVISAANPVSGALIQGGEMLVGARKPTLMNIATAIATGASAPVTSTGALVATGAAATAQQYFAEKTQAAYTTALSAQTQRLIAEQIAAGKSEQARQQAATPAAPAVIPSAQAAQKQGIDPFMLALLASVILS